MIPAYAVILQATALSRIKQSMMTSNDGATNTPRGAFDSSGGEIRTIHILYMVPTVCFDLLYKASIVVLQE